MGEVGLQYSTLLSEIQNKRKDARFQKVDCGLFAPVK